MTSDSIEKYKYHPRRVLPRWKTTYVPAEHTLLALALAILSCIMLATSIYFFCVATLDLRSVELKLFDEQVEKWNGHMRNTFAQTEVHKWPDVWSLSTNISPST